MALSEGSLPGQLARRYAAAFGEAPRCLNLAALPAAWFDELAAAIWTMSPPCQPHSRQGNQRDVEDTRCAERGSPMCERSTVWTRANG